jgi:hypothetical protein
MKVELERCALCGSEVRHTHPGRNRETDSPCKVCCTCRDNLHHPLEDFLKEATPPHGSFNRVPCVIDEVMDLDDEGILVLYANALESIDTDKTLENVLRSTAPNGVCGGTRPARAWRSDRNDKLRSRA